MGLDYHSAREDHPLSVKASVVICTFNRVDYIRLAVESLTHQTIPTDQFEIIVVDNASTDATPEVIKELLPAISNLKYIYEDKQGLSHARNRGTKESEGEIVVFLDDDAIAEPEFLEAHLRSFTKDPSPIATGGRIYLRWPIERPRWVPVSQESFYSGLDLGDEPQLLEFPKYPYGANMAIDRKTLVDIGGFSIELGRSGNNLISGEERDLFLRVSQSGGLVVYVPDAIVHHCVLEERVQKKWLLRRSFAQGRSAVAMEVVAQGRPPLSRLMPRTLLHWARSANRFIGLSKAVLLRRGPAEVMDRAGNVLYWVGSAYEGTRMIMSYVRSKPR